MFNKRLIFKLKRALLPVIIVLVGAVSFYACSGGGGDTKGTAVASKVKDSKVVIEPSGNSAKDSFKMGVQYSLRGDHKKAIEAYKRSLNENPTGAVAYSNLAFEYFDTKEYALSVKNQEKALDLDPDISNAYYGLAMALEKTGNKEGAIENYQEFQNLSEPHTLWWNRAKANIERLEAGL